MYMIGWVIIVDRHVNQNVPYGEYPLPYGTHVTEPGQYSTPPLSPRLTNPSAMGN